VCLAAVEGLAGLAQAARQPVVDQGQLEGLLEGVEDRDLSAAAGGIARDFDLVGGGDDGRGGLFSVRLRRRGISLCFTWSWREREIETR
jgi:hypothetical protein